MPHCTLACKETGTSNSSFQKSEDKRFIDRVGNLLKIHFSILESYQERYDLDLRKHEFNQNFETNINIKFAVHSDAPVFFVFYLAHQKYFSTHLKLTNTCPESRKQLLFTGIFPYNFKKFWNGSSVYSVELDHPFACYIHNSFRTAYR